MTRWQDQLGSLYGDSKNTLGKYADKAIYGMGFTDDDKNKVKYIVAGIPYVGTALKNADSYRKTTDYLTNRGLSWSDVEYPALTSTQSYGSLITSISHNLKDVYDDYEEDGKRLYQYRKYKH